MGRITIDVWPRKLSRDAVVHVWHEGDHPREEGGQFAEGSGVASRPAPPVKKLRKRDSDRKIKETKEAIEVVKGLLVKTPGDPIWSRSLRIHQANLSKLTGEPMPTEQSQSTPEPAKSTETTSSTEVPESVRRTVSNALTQLRTTEQEIKRAREHLDAPGTFAAGGGRYESDVIQNHSANIAGARQALQKFREMAAKRGVDADKVIADLGGEPDLTPSPAAKKWLEHAAL